MVSQTVTNQISNKLVVAELLRPHGKVREK